LRVFLSFSFAYQLQAEAMASALREAGGVDQVFLSSDTLVGGARWLEELQLRIHTADAFVFLLGQQVGNWQRIEFSDAFDRKVAEDHERALTHRPPLPLVPVVFESGAPGTLLRRDDNGLPFIQRLHLIVDFDAFTAQGNKIYSNPITVEKIARGLHENENREAAELWRGFNPYRGLLALREQDADFLFGRDDDIERFVTAIAQLPFHAIMALGASGVGKSSLILAGVFAALERQRLPKGAWPTPLSNSRLWPRLRLTPGNEPLRSLVGAFLRLWIDPTEPEFRQKANAWTEILGSGDGLDGLIEAADEALRRQQGSVPPRYLLYVDQGEELYTRGGRDPGRDRTSKETIQQKNARRFSELLAEAALHTQITLLISARSDFLDRIQADTPIFRVRHQLDVEPLGEKGLAEVVRRPAELLGVGFDRGLDVALVSSTREQSGGLPLLSDTLDILWKEMQQRGDGVLRWTEEIGKGVDVTRKLAERADAFIHAHEDKQDLIRRLFCVRLAHVPQQGAATRRTAFLDELDKLERDLVTELSASDQRIIATGEVDGRAYAEVAHEALFSAWKTLQEWIAARRSFYAWATQLANERRDWETTGKRRGALLSGRPLERARSFAESDGADLPAGDLMFVQQSVIKAKRTTITTGVLLASIVALLAALSGFAGWKWIEADQARVLANSTLIRVANSLSGASEAMLEKDPVYAGLIALEGLPDEAARNFTPVTRRAEIALSNALDNIRETHVFGGAKFRITAAKFDKTGNKVVGLGDDNVLRIWDRQSGALLREILIPTKTTELYIGEKSRVVMVKRTFGAEKSSSYDIVVAELEKVNVPAHRRYDNVLEFWVPPDGSSYSLVQSRSLFSVVVQTVSTETGQVISDVELEKAFAESHTRFIRAGDRLIGIHERGEAALIWDLSTGKLIGGVSPVTLWKAGIGRLPDQVEIAISHDGKLMAARFSGSEISIWDLTDGRRRGSLRISEDTFTMEFEPTGKFMTVVAGTFNTAKSTDLPRLLYVIDTDKMEIVARVSFGPGFSEIKATWTSAGELIAFAPSAQIEVWNNRGERYFSRQLIFQVTGEELSEVDYLDDGRSLLVVTQRGSVHLFSLPNPTAEPPVIYRSNDSDEIRARYSDTSALIEFARKKLPRCLTPGQRAERFLSEDVPPWCGARRKWPFN
jgi:WD40 repeat protein